MKLIEAQAPETNSADLVEANIEALKALFPDAFTEGRIDFDLLKQLLGGAIDEREEKYGLNWHGKRQARHLALTPSNGTLRPAPEDSVNWDTTQNLLIEGDNLEVLKLLQKSYAGEVKLIYIDPPYNTGKDFIYKDDFVDSIRNYQTVTGQVDQSGAKLTTNAEASGRYHTDWLNMMYPRLSLAKNLLNQAGAVFISCDDHEIANLRSICDAVFGPENFIATIIWQRIFSPKNSARHFSEDHDYIVVYAKSADTWAPRVLPRTPEMEARYTNPDNDPRGAWTSGDLSARNYYGQGTYAVTSPSGNTIDGPPPGRYWAVSQSKFLAMDADNRIYWGESGNNTPRMKRFLKDVLAGRVPQTLWTYEEVGHTQEAKKELLEAVPFRDSGDVFETPKPTRLIKRILELATTPDGSDLVLDFFIGSGTTGVAVYDKNIEDNGNRRFIGVQIPANLDSVATLRDETKLHTLSDITKERLRRSGLKIRSRTPLSDSIDLGFRVFKLDSTNIRPWEPNRDKLSETLEESVEHIKAGRTEQDILYEVLLKLGLELTVSIETRTIAGKTVYSVGAGALLVCLSESIMATEVEPLAMGMLEWHTALAPVVESTVVFRDSAFADDVAKTNLNAILTQHGIENVRSL